ncbi:RNA-binding domain-containing protein [Flavobacterium filum]|uniref:RNA-binding domain-containing protein n=1 Tax=Flavobacterium filum TaxID=370974 RepID=UPI000426B498|nr:RNA-binding domain-containing protein [Flavobacterium filum]
MKQDDVNYINEILQKSESSTLEFKARFDKDNIAKVICSFLNRDGGHLVIGKEENQTLVGVKDAEKLAVEIQSYLVSEIIPEPAISVDVQSVNNKKLLILSVWQGTNQPYIYKGGVYYRVGSSTVKADSKQLAALIHKDSNNNQRWETKSAIEVDVEDIDLNEVHKCIIEANTTARENNIPDNPLQFLSKYGLYQNGDFTNACVILFGKHPAKFFPQVRIRISAFNTDKTGNTLLYDRIFDDNLFHSIRQITDFFDLAYGVSSSFNQSNWKRTDKLSYPKLAIREALLNAFIHRDYSSFSSSIAVNIYPNKLQISSYGNLPKGISVKSLVEDHLSIPVNPTIAHIFFLRNWIEKIGIGTVKMIANCKELGFKIPTWTVKDNTVTVTFPDLVVPFNYSEGITEGITEGIEVLLNDIKNEGINEGISKGITDIVKESYKDIITLIIKEKSIRASDIADKLERSYKTIERHISTLKEIGAIEFEGSKKTGGYVISEKLKKIISKK